MPSNIQFSDLAVKLIGNIGICIVFARYYQKPVSTGTMAGIIRTVLGMMISMMLVYSFQSPEARAIGIMAFLIFGWLPLMAWAVVFWVFFKDPPPGRTFIPLVLFAGIIYSGVLELISHVVGAKGFRMGIV
jgi:hypothetical protein